MAIVPSAAASIRVSLIEDDRDTRAHLRAAVEAEPDLCLFGAYATGNDLMLALPYALPDVLLVDLGLPDRPGLELIKEISTRYPQVDILVYTAFGDETNVLAALRAGAGGYLLKGNLAHGIGFDIRDIKNGGAPMSPLIARYLLRLLPQPALASPVGAPDDEASLTPRELDILNAIARGYSYAEVARMLGIGSGTVHTHLKRVYRKLAANSKTEAVFEARRRGLLS